VRFLVEVEKWIVPREVRFEAHAPSFLHPHSLLLFFNPPRKLCNTNSWGQSNSMATRRTLSLPNEIWIRILENLKKENDLADAWMLCRQVSTAFRDPLNPYSARDIFQRVGSYSCWVKVASANDTHLLMLSRLNVQRRR